MGIMEKMGLKKTMPADWMFGFPGDVKKHYEFGTQQLGSGGFGVTWRGTAKTNGQNVAVKEIDKSAMRKRGDDPSLLKKEVDFLYKLRGHPNIVNLLGAFEEKDKLYIVMELCTGGELFQRIIRKGHYSEADAANIIKQMLKVVAECHLEGIVHRDIKPENFLFATNEENSTLKLIDFGLAGKINYSQTNSGTDAPMHESVGTLFYVAPEVIEGNYNQLADLWSIGVICYTMLCGCLPFWGKTPDEIYRAVKSRDVDFVEAPWKDVSAQAKDFVKGLLDKNPSTRLSASQALSHPWLQEGGAPDVPLDVCSIVMMHRFQNVGKFTQVALERLAQSTNIEERKDIVDQFNAIDRDRDGIIVLEEWKAAASKLLADQLTENTMEKVFNEVDFDNSGSISFHEFAAATMRIRQLARKHGPAFLEEVKSVFQGMDIDGDGYIDVAELEKVARAGSTAADLLAEADTDNDGKISYKEYMAVLDKADSLHGRLRQ